MLRGFLVRRALCMSYNLCGSKKNTSYECRPGSAFPVQNVRFGFAKISKKEQEKQDKKKEKDTLRGNIENTSNIDLEKFTVRYQEILSQADIDLAKVKIGRLQSASFDSVYVKVGNQSLPLSNLAQIAPKGVNSCVISPYDVDNFVSIEKALIICDAGFEIVKGDKSITVTQQTNNTQEQKAKMVIKAKKIIEDAKDRLKRHRGTVNDELSKYKKIIPIDRFKTIETEFKAMFDQYIEKIDKTEKTKIKELQK